jgi:N-acetylmuramoyl-L-alanine amidase
MVNIIRILIWVFVFTALKGSLNAQNFSKVDRVVIDAGHGGKDSGAKGRSTLEKEIALSVALKVGKLINQNLQDVEVVYTRKTDVFIELFKRAEIANKAKADLFISIHCNSTTGPSAIGTEVWVLGTHRSEKNLEVAKKENSAILLEADYSKNYDNFDPNSPESYITLSLIQGAYREQSISFADDIQNQFTQNLRRHDRGVKEAGFLVLVYTTMPGVLVELGFLSNPTEEKYLDSETGQEQLALAIYQAFRKYKMSIEGSNEGQPEPIIPVQVESKKAVDSAKVINDSLSSGATCYAVQFTTRTKSVSISKSFPSIEDVWYYEQSKIFKYVSGHYKSLDEANDALKKIKQKNYSDAFVVAFIEGKRVSKEELQKYLNTKSEKRK